MTSHFGRHGGSRLSGRGVAAGLKSGGLLDVALVVNDGPEFSAASVLTPKPRAGSSGEVDPVGGSGRVTARGRLELRWRQRVHRHPAAMQDTAATANHVAAKRLECDAQEVAVCSTGLIGVRLPMQELLDGVTSAASALTPEGVTTPPRGRS